MAYYKIIEQTSEKNINLPQQCLTTNSLRMLRISKPKLNTYRKATLGNLQKEHNIFWDLNSYYLPNFNTTANIKKVDFFDIQNMRDYLTCNINDIYLRHCREDGITPKGMISIPEHFTNTCIEIVKSKDVLRTLNEKCFLEEVIFKHIEKITNKMISRYVDKRGTVYYTSYDKQIKSAVKDIIEFNKDSKNKFSRLLPNYLGVKPNFRFLKVNFSSIDKDKYFEVLKNIEAAEKLISMLIPPKYRIQVDIEINDSFFDEIDKKIYYFGLLDPYSERIILRNTSDVATIFHEYVHAIMDFNWKYENQEIVLAENDFMFEITKGKPIFTWQNERGESVFKYKPIDLYTNIHTPPYFTKLPKETELYSSSNELLASICAKIASNIRLEGNTIIDNYRNRKSNLRSIVSANFDSLLEHYPITLGAFALSFFRGDFTN